MLFFKKNRCWDVFLLCDMKSKIKKKKIEKNLVVQIVSRWKFNRISDVSCARFIDDNADAVEVFFLVFFFCLFCLLDKQYFVLF